MAPAPTPNWTHPATVTRVIDGDTVVARIDLGRYPEKVLVEATVRLAGLYAPERNEPGGREATVALQALVLGVELVASTRKPNPRDPYGRIVADLYLANGQTVAEVMIANGHGRAEP